MQWAMSSLWQFCFHHYEMQVHGVLLWSDCIVFKDIWMLLLFSFFIHFDSHYCILYIFSYCMLYIFCAYILILEICSCLSVTSIGCSSDILFFFLCEQKMAEGPPSKKPCRTDAVSDLHMFDELFPTLVDSLSKNGLKDPEIKDAIRWFKKVCLVLCMYIWWQCMPQKILVLHFLLRSMSSMYHMGRRTEVSLSYTLIATWQLMK